MPPKTRKRKSTTNPDTPTESKTTNVKGTMLDDHSRATDTHVFFWGGVLSNWNVGAKFPGARCFELLVPELEKLNVSHPPLDAFVSRLLKDHMFNCGEQWMMAMKGWLFERDFELGNWVVSEDEEADFQRLKAEMYTPRLPRTWAGDSRERVVWEGTVCRVLRNKAPRQQKALGRSAKGFDAEVWSKVNMACVTAACIARAEEDAALRQVYLSCGERRFVEGSPYDTVWGVGLHWKSAEIDDPAVWKGENRLGKCHDLAAHRIKGTFNNGETSLSGSSTKTVE